MTLITRTVAFLTILFCSLNATANNLKIGVNKIGENFDVRYTLDANGYWALRLMSKSLIAGIDEATSAATLIKKEPLAYTFKLKDINFTDGSALTAKTVKEFYLDLMNNKKTTVYKATLENIKSIDILDKKTLRFNFKDIDNFPEAKFASPLIFKQTSNGAVGLGPYTIDEFKFPFYLKLKSVDNTLYYKNIEFFANSMPVVNIIKLMKGDIDVIHGGLQTMQINLLKEKGFALTKSDGANYSYLGFNLQDKLVGQLEVRKALAYAIDMDSIIKYLYLGYAEKAGSLLSAKHVNYKPNFIKYNPQKAINILENAGFKKNADGIRLEIDFSITTNNQSLRYAQILQDQLKTIGVKLNILTSDWGRFYNDIKAGKAQMYALGWVGIFDGDIYKDLFNSKSIGDGGLNRSNYINPTMDKLTNKIISEKLSVKQMHETLFAIQDLQFNDMIYIPLWKKQNTVISNPKIKTYRPTLDGGFDDIINVR